MLIGALFDFRRRRYVPAFAKLRDYVEQATKRSFTEYQLRQVLGVLPSDAVEVSWKRDQRRIIQDVMHLLLGPLKHEAIVDHALRAIFAHVVRYHREFLHSREETLPTLRPLEITTWHSEFALDDVPGLVAIPLPRPRTGPTPLELLSLREAELPEKPQCAPLPAVEMPVVTAPADVVKHVVARQETMQRLKTAIAAGERDDLIRLADLAMQTIAQGPSVAVDSVLDAAQRCAHFRHREKGEVEKMLADLVLQSDRYFQVVEIRRRKILLIDRTADAGGFSSVRKKLLGSQCG